MEAFNFLDVKEWTSQDCLDWATNTCLQLGLKFYEVEIEGFGFLSGTQLSNFSEKDFCRKIGHLHGPKFYKVFAKLLRKRNKKNSSYDLSNSPEEAHERVASSESHVESMTHLNLDDSNDSWREKPLSPEPTELPLREAYSWKQYCDLEYSSQEYYEPKTEEKLYLGHAEPDSEEKIYHHLESTTNYGPIEDLRRTDECSSHTSQSGEHTFESPSSTSFTDYPSSKQSSQDESREKEKKWKQKIKNKNRPKRVRDPFVWEFLLMLLQDSDFNPSHIKWEDERRGVFKLVQKEEVAREWGERTEKHKQAPLTYGHFSRSLRYHYTSGFLQPVSEKHLVYKFGPRVMELHFSGDRK